MTSVCYNNMCTLKKKTIKKQNKKQTQLLNEWYINIANETVNNIILKLMY